MCLNMGIFKEFYTVSCYRETFQESPTDKEHEGKEGHIPEGLNDCVWELQRNNLFRGLSTLVAQTVWLPAG